MTPMFHQKESAAQIERLRHFTRVTRALTHLTTAEAIHELLLHGALDLLHSERAVLLLREDDERYGAALSHGFGPEGWPLAPLAIDAGFRPRLAATIGEHLFAVPLNIDDEIEGVIALQSPYEHTATDIVWLLSALLDHGAMALSHARMLEQESGRLQNELPHALGAPEQRQFLMSAMAHDLRTPLLSIRMGCDLLEDTLEPITDEQADILGHIRMARNHVQTVAENLLEMGRLSAGMSTVDCRPSQAGKLLEEAVAVVWPEAESRAIPIESAYPAEDLAVLADRPKLRQVLVNLLGNAIKYNPRDRPIGAAVQAHDDRHTAFIISDHGPGIPHRERERVFMPYYRILTSDGPAKTGVGLGLAIAHELTRKMHGSIQIEDTPGGGATFIVLLPKP